MEPTEYVFGRDPGSEVWTEKMAAWNDGSWNRRSICTREFDGACYYLGHESETTPH